MHAARSLQSRNRLAAKRLKVEIALGLQGVNLELSGDVHSHSYYLCGQATVILRSTTSSLIRSCSS